MSYAVSRSSRRQSNRFTGLPVWSALAIFVAALITGLLISYNGQELSWPFLLAFTLAAIVITVLVEARGLFLTVASGPVFFLIYTLLSSWLVTRSQSAEGSDPFSTTAIITSVYPLTQYFPWLFWVTVICVLIAVGRLWLLRRNARLAERTELKRRRHYAAAEKENRDRYASVRARTQRSERGARGSGAERITVQELMERNRSDGHTPGSRRVDRDLYED